MLFILFVCLLVCAFYSLLCLFSAKFSVYLIIVHYVATYLPAYLPITYHPSQYCRICSVQSFLSETSRTAELPHCQILPLAFSKTNYFQLPFPNTLGSFLKAGFVTKPKEDHLQLFLNNFSYFTLSSMGCLSCDANRDVKRVNSTVGQIG